MTSPQFRPSPILYVGMTSPNSFDVSVEASAGFVPALVIAARLKVQNPDGDESTWTCSIVPDDEDDRLTARRNIEAGDLTVDGDWTCYLEVQFGTFPGEWFRVGAGVLPVLPEFQTRRPL